MPGRSGSHSGPHWGWHRLADHSARRLVLEAGIRRGDLVIDVGAGTGALTAWLVATGARVIAVELHPRRAQVLRRRFSRDRVTVVRADASDLRLPRRPFRVVANPPFATTAALVRRLLGPGSRLVAADLVVPVHVARRWASPNAPGRLRWAKAFAIAVGPRVPRSAFSPPSPIDVAVLRIRLRDLSARENP